MSSKRKRKPRSEATVHPAPAGEARGLPRVRWLALLVAALAVIPYANTLTNGFVLDDVSIVAENPMIRDIGNVGQMVRTNYWGTTGRDASAIDPGLYRPLTIFSYALDYRVWSLKASGYHLTNVLLHAAASVMVLLVAVETVGSRAAATLGAAIFAVHPVHTEAVSSIVGRAEVLATLFFLLAFRLLRLRMAAAGLTVPGWLGVAVGAVLYLLGLFSKETAVTLPVVLAVDDWLPRGELRGDSNGPARRVVITRYAALTIALAVYLFIRQSAVTEPAKQWPGFVGVPASHRIFTASRVVAEYLGLFVFPRTLSADYWKLDVPIATSLINAPVLFSLALWVAIAAVVGWKFRRERALLFGLAWFFITLAPASNVFFASGIGKAERILYLPSIGLCLVAAWAYARVESAVAWKRWLPIGMAPLVLVLGARTLRRNVDWKDNLTLAGATLKVAPESPLMNDIAAGELVQRGDARSAIPLLHDAIRQAPTMPGLHTHLGAAYYQQGSIAEAIEAYKHALQLNANDADARANLGLAYLDAQQTDSAIAQLEGARRLNPGDARLENNLGVARMRRGELDRAVEHYQRALQLRPDYAAARANLDRLLAQRVGGSKK